MLLQSKSFCSSRNFNALPFTIALPKSFPVPVKGRDDFFSVDPKSLNNEQLHKYKKEMVRFIDIEQKNLERLTKDSNTRMNTYNQGILLAQKTIKTNSIRLKNLSRSPFLPNFKFNIDEPVNYTDPKTLTITQLQLYIAGINEELLYEKNLTEEFRKESSSRIEAYENGIQYANDELSMRKGK